MVQRPGRRDLVQGEYRVSVGAAGAHLRCHPDGFHDLLRARSAPERRPGVAADAEWALRDVSHGDGDQLLGLRGQRAFGEYGFAEG